MENQEGFNHISPEDAEREDILMELEAINNELIADNSSHHLSEEAYAAKEARKRELEERLGRNNSAE